MLTNRGGFSIKGVRILRVGTKLVDLTFCNPQPYLQDHPRTRKWLIPMVCKSPKDRVVGPLPKPPKWLVNRGY